MEGEERGRLRVTNVWIFEGTCCRGGSEGVRGCCWNLSGLLLSISFFMGRSVLVD